MSYFSLFFFVLVIVNGDSVSLLVDGGTFMVQNSDDSISLIFHVFLCFIVVLFLSRDLRFRSRYC